MIQITLFFADRKDQSLVCLRRISEHAPSIQIAVKVLQVKILPNAPARARKQLYAGGKFTEITGHRWRTSGPKWTNM
jgi:hypothetical protein